LHLLHRGYQDWPAGFEERRVNNAIETASLWSVRAWQDDYAVCSTSLGNNTTLGINEIKDFGTIAAGHTSMSV